MCLSLLLSYLCFHFCTVFLFYNAFIIYQFFLKKSKNDPLLILAAIYIHRFFFFFSNQPVYLVSSTLQKHGATIYTNDNLDAPKQVTNTHNNQNVNTHKQKRYEEVLSNLFLSQQLLAVIVLLILSTWCHFCCCYIKFI